MSFYKFSELIITIAIQYEGSHFGTIENITIIITHIGPISFIESNPLRLYGPTPILKQAPANSSVLWSL